ncbi:unnamed protein product [Coccothraustes coccothraustes]
MLMDALHSWIGSAQNLLAQLKSPCTAYTYDYLKPTQRTNHCLEILFILSNFRWRGPTPSSVYPRASLSSQPQ